MPSSGNCAGICSLVTTLPSGLGESWSEKLQKVSLSRRSFERDTLAIVFDLPSPEHRSHLVTAWGPFPVVQCDGNHVWPSEAKR